MKQFIRLFVFLWVMGILGAGSVSWADEITIVSDQYPPYNDQPGSRAPGYAVEIVQRVFEKAGHQVVYKIVPWARAIMETRQGIYSAIIAALPSDAPDFVFPGNEIGMAQYCFYTRKGDSWRYAGIPSLAGKKIGVVNAYSYTAELDAFFLDNPQAVGVGGGGAVEKNVKKLLSSRIDMFIENATVVSFMDCQGHFMQKIDQAGCDTREIGKLFIAFGPNNPKSQEYARILSEGIDALRSSGELKELLL
ncbi:MAG: transporter substrate-binding domain-containing protein, partial [Candidatus Omnitrophota bacterium]